MVLELLTDAELCARVAREIMHFSTTTTWAERARAGRLLGRPEFVADGTPVYVWCGTPAIACTQAEWNPLGNLEHIGVVLAQLRGRGLCVELHETDTGWMAALCRPDGGPRATASAVDAGRALCLAALKEARLRVAERNGSPRTARAGQDPALSSLQA